MRGPLFRIVLQGHALVHSSDNMAATHFETGPDSAGIEFASQLLLARWTLHAHHNHVRAHLHITAVASITVSSIELLDFGDAGATAGLKRAR